MSKTITWYDFLSKEKLKPYFIKIMNTISQKRSMGIKIYPPNKDIFNAFNYTALNKIKVVIIGQDPYYKFGQAHGLSFSVLPNVYPLPSSLINIYRELANDIKNFKYPGHGYLGSWAKQGVLLLNMILTVEDGKAYSHSDIGWKQFTTKAINFVNTNCDRVAFLLWGSKAQEISNLIDRNRHYILNTSHPSSLSAHLGFIGCKHFSKTNNWLKSIGVNPIDWTPKLK